MPAALTPPLLKIVAKSRRWLPRRSRQDTARVAFTCDSASKFPLPVRLAAAFVRITVKLRTAGAGETPGRAKVEIVTSSLN
jgi:hypothetical protein